MKTLSSRIVLNALKSFDRKVVWLVDANYAFIKNSEVNKYIDEQNQAVLDILGQYVSDRVDCDKFALLMKAFALIGHARQSNKKAGLAFGFIAYRQDIGGGHAINIVLTEETGVIYTRFFEPQSKKEVFLSENEINNTMFILI